MIAWQVLQGRRKFLIAGAYGVIAYVVVLAALLILL